MALYWHPYFAGLLRRHCGQVLEVQETVTLGDLLLEADLLLIRRDPAQALPFPYSFLGQYTLVEYKSPDDTADQVALVQLESYGLLWLQRARQIQRSGLTLWLAASRFSQSVSTVGGAEVVQTAALGPGLLGGAGGDELSVHRRHAEPGCAGPMSLPSAPTASLYCKRPRRATFVSPPIRSPR